MSVNSNLIRQLRDKTGAGILDCKSALLENDGNLDKSIDWLRKKGLSVAAKKSGRVAAQGLVGTYVSGNVGCIIEVNSQTDFVSRNEVFQKFVENCCKLGINSNSDINLLYKMKYLNSDRTVKEELTNNIATIGENLNVRRVELVKLKNEGVIISYVHNSVVDNMGKIGVLICLESSAEKDLLIETGKKIAMHVAATNPLSISINDLNKEIIEKEKMILTEQALSSGKTKEIAEKMVEGRMKKFFQEVVLESQTFVMDENLTIKSLLENFAKITNNEVKITDFKKLVLGEGIEVEEKDFAEEVAATVKQ